MSVLPQGADRFGPLKKADAELTKLPDELTRSRGRVVAPEAEGPDRERYNREAFADALARGGKGVPDRQAVALAAELEDERRKMSSLELAVTRQQEKLDRLLEQSRSSSRRQQLRAVAKASSRYAASVAELEAAREGLAMESALESWLSGQGFPGIPPTLGGRNGGGALNIGPVLEALKADVPYLAGHATDQDEPAPRLRPELATGGGNKRGWGG